MLIGPTVKLIANYFYHDAVYHDFILKKKFIKKIKKKL